jgi:hypothetical protein
MEMMSSNEHGDMKLMDFQDSLIAHDEAESKCSEQSPASTKNGSNSVCSLKTKSLYSEVPSKIPQAPKQLEVSPNNFYPKRVVPYYYN